MLVRAALDTKALVQEGAGDPDGIDACERLLDALVRYGVYIHPEQDLRDSPLIAAVRSISDPSLRKRWEIALSHGLRHAPGPRSWRGLEVHHDRPHLECLDGHCDLAALTDRAADALDIEPSPGYRQLERPRLEAARFRRAPSAEGFRRARELAERPISEGQPVEELWKERFLFLAEHSKDICVVDRFCMSTSLDDHRNCRSTRSGIRRFLVGVNSCAEGTNVRVCSSVREYHARDLREHLAEIAESLYPGIRSLELVLVEDTEFKVISHGRRIRFDQSVCELDIGLDVLKGERVHRQSDFTLKPCSEEHRAVERKLAQRASEVWRRP